MHPAALGRELRALRHLVRERVAESVLDLGIEQLLVNEVRAAQRHDGTFEIFPREIADPAQQLLGKPEPDRRGGLQHRLLALRQAVDARGKDAVHRRRNLESIDRRAEAIRASFPDEAARLDQRVNDLLDEERVAAGALAHQRRQARQGRISAEEVREQLVDRLGTERMQRHLLVRGPLHPLGAVLGAEVQQQHRARPRHDVGDLREERIAPLVDPVGVVEEQHRRLTDAARLYQPAGEVEELALAYGGIHARSRTLRVGDSEEVKGERQERLEVAVEQQHAPGDLLTRQLIPVLVCDPEVVAKYFQDGQQRDHLAVGRTVRLVDGDAARPAVLDELEAQPTLPDAGFGDDTDDPAAPFEGAVERRLQHCQLVGAADEARKPAGPGPVEPAAQRADTGELVDGHGSADALQIEGAEVAQLEVPLDQARRVLREIGAVRGGALLHALRQADGVALGGVVHA